MRERTGRARFRTRLPRRMLLALPFALLLLAVRAGAVAVSPVALYIDDRTRTGTLTLFNPGTRPEEVAIDFAFGYPTSDSTGEVSVGIVEEAPAGEPSAVAWLRAFPRRLVLEPGQRQVVRVMVQPPPELAPGEYWARVLVRGRGGQPPIEQQQGDVRVQIEVETVVIVALSYRNGAVETGIRIANASAVLAGDTVAATIDFERAGNAAFIGRVRAEVLDANGRVIGTAEDVLAVYRQIRRRLQIPVTGATGQALRVRFTIDTDRDDLPPGAVLPFESMQHIAEVRR